MNSSFPDKWSFSYVTHKICHSHNRWTKLYIRTARTSNSKKPQQKYHLGTVGVKILGGGVLNRFYGYPTSPSAFVLAQKPRRQYTTTFVRQSSPVLRDVQDSLLSNKVEEIQSFADEKAHGDVLWCTNDALRQFMVQRGLKPSHFSAQIEAYVWQIKMLCWKVDRTLR